MRVLSTVLVAALGCGSAACRKAPAPGATASAASPAQAAAAGQTPAAAPAPAPPKPMPAALPEVLARVNGENVTKADFDRLIKNMELSANQPIPPDRKDEIYRRALDQLVTYTVLSQETRARKVTVSDAEIESTVKQMQSQFPNEAEFKKALTARGMTIERLRADARLDMSINKMKQIKDAIFMHHIIISHYKR